MTEPLDRSAPLTARSWLFVPGDRSDRFLKAQASGAGVVVLDLEDAVQGERKPAARREVVAALEAGGDYVVRVSALEQEDGRQDIAALVGASARPVAILAAKAEEAAAMEAIAHAVGAPVVALIESARGLEAVSELARSKAVMRLALGAVDLTLDLGAEPHADVLAPIRSRLVVASRAAGIAAPLDTPSIEIRQLAHVRDEAKLAKRFGMGGKLCIHPAQVPEVEAAFRSSEAEAEWAAAVLEAALHEGAAQFDGQMIDRPVLERARRILADSAIDADRAPSTTLP
ncbi:HpcH/HpaI aldolase/citrate lyase family protein [Agrococcus baldri]|uniref:Citryl-CoA lyase n=1 Tax=Agrococcus baldri TaxID=153730 RepID=A0AA87RPG3_9MICO|nr:CoA ester lyase [Agrococcus baldri]GEK81672.1 citryl-CoA lyase [Agrococcus baldri]